MILWVRYICRLKVANAEEINEGIYDVMKNKRLRVE